MNLVTRDPSGGADPGRSSDVTANAKRPSGPTPKVVAPLDTAALRTEFPILDRVNSEGRRLVYLDSASTAQKPQAVIDAMSAYYEHSNANVHRGVHSLAGEATALYEGARIKLAGFVNAWDRRGVIFTRNFTEAANLLAYAWARPRLGPGDEIVATVLEHHSNLVPWQLAAKAQGAQMRYLDLTDDGHLDLSELDRLIGARTRLVVCSGMSNVLGIRPDLAPIIAAAHDVGAKVFVDGAQLTAHAPVDVQALDADFYGLTGHKLCGPTGIGALVARPELLEEMEPFMAGGDMVSDVTLEGARWNELPHKFEAGTPPIAEAAGLAAALDYLTDIGMERIAAHEATLAAYGFYALGHVPGLELYGPADPSRSGAVFTFNLSDANGNVIHPHDVGTVLDHREVAIRVGHHCAMPLTRRLGAKSTCRASAYLYNDERDIDRLAGALHAARDFFRR